MDDPAFEPVSEYCAWEFKNSLPNEIGRIKTKENYYHIILGGVAQKGCPFCGGEPKLLRLPSDRNLFDKYCIQCTYCESRGRSAYIHEYANEKEWKHMRDLLLFHFKNPFPWDKDLVNPYEKAHET